MKPPRRPPWTSHVRVVCSNCWRVACCNAVCAACLCVVFPFITRCCRTWPWVTMQLALCFIGHRSVFAVCVCAELLSPPVPQRSRSRGPMTTRSEGRADSSGRRSSSRVCGLCEYRYVCLYVPVCSHRVACRFVSVVYRHGVVHVRALGTCFPYGESCHLITIAWPIFNWQSCCGMRVSPASVTWRLPPPFPRMLPPRARPRLACSRWLPYHQEAHRRRRRRSRCKGSRRWRRECGKGRRAQ